MSRTRAHRTPQVAEPGAVDLVEPDEVEEVEEEEAEETEEEEVEDKPVCFVSNHTGITVKARKDLVQRRLEILGGVFSTVDVCMPHAAMLDAAKHEVVERKKSRELAPHGSCHVCGRAVGILPVTDAGDYSSYRFHMDDVEQRCCETCLCTVVNPDNGEPVGRKRATIWLKPLEK